MNTLVLVDKQKLTLINFVCDTGWRLEHLLKAIGTDDEKNPRESVLWVRLDDNDNDI